MREDYSIAPPAAAGMVRPDHGKRGSAWLLSTGLWVSCPSTCDGDNFNQNPDQDKNPSQNTEISVRDDDRARN